MPTNNSEDEGKRVIAVIEAERKRIASIKRPTREEEMLADLYSTYLKQLGNIAGHIASEFDVDALKSKLLNKADKSLRKAAGDIVNDVNRSVTDFKEGLVDSIKEKFEKKTAEDIKLASSEAYNKSNNTKEKIKTDMDVRASEIAKFGSQSSNDANSSNKNAQTKLAKLKNTQKTPNNIVEHLEALKQIKYGFFRSNLFEFTFVNLPNKKSSSIFENFGVPTNLMAKGIEFSHDQLASIRTKYDMHNSAIASNRTLSNTLSVTFYDDNSGNTREFISKWINTTVPTMNTIPFLDEYSAEIKITKLNDKYNAIETYNFNDVFPLSVGATQMTYGSSGTIMEISVTFAYKEHTRSLTDVATN